LYFLHSIYPSLLEVINHGERLKRRVRQHILKVNDGEDNEDKHSSVVSHKYFTKHGLILCFLLPASYCWPTQRQAASDQLPVASGQWPVASDQKPVENSTELKICQTTFVTFLGDITLACC
jgi:hypothetical protein